MTTHLTSDELVDAVEGTLADHRTTHLAGCEVCTREVASLAAVLREASDLGIPEPSPLFWERLSDRVRTAIAAEPAPGGGVASWLKWPVLAPIGALALVVLALVMTLPAPTMDPVQQAARLEETASDVTLSEDGWSLVTEIVGELDWETASAAGLTVAPGDAERAVLELSLQEQQELHRLLTAELERAKS